MFNQKSAVAVIGAGPAGLAAACSLTHQGVDVTVYEAGKELSKRVHNVAQDLGVGIGGAGLFSDGKFSYYPSGTHVYQLTNPGRRREAYYWLLQQLQGVNIGTEPFPEENRQYNNTVGSLLEKKYPSHYASLEQRKLLINRLCQAITKPVIINTKVQHILQTSEGYVIETDNHNPGIPDTHTFSAIVLAIGKLGSIALTEEGLSDIIPLKPQRYEFGLRLECHHSVGFMNRSAACDIKYLWQSGPAQFRTFCTCRRGEVWGIPYDTLTAIAGRTDGIVTDYSNFGVLARFKGASFNVGERFWNHLKEKLLRSRQVTWEPLGSFLQNSCTFNESSLDLSSRPWYPYDNFKQGEIRILLGEDLYRLIKSAVEDLLSWSPDLIDHRTVCLFPTVEGIGYYPDIDEDLKVWNHNIWCVGDVVGRFRGLIPALLSGYYVGLSVKESLSSN